MLSRSASLQLLLIGVVACMALPLAAAQENTQPRAPRVPPSRGNIYIRSPFAALASTSASPLFASAVTYSTFDAYNPYAAVAADVNGDGKPDLMVAYQFRCTPADCNHGAVAVLLGNGDGTFQAGVSYDSGGWVSESVAVADVNGDGNPDLIVTNGCFNVDCGTDGSVGVLLGNGDGTFQTAVTYDAGGTSTQSVTVADVNGDGKPDLLVANFADRGSAGVLLNNGDGTFQTAVIYSLGPGDGTSVAVADVNGDLKPDLVVANYYHGVSVLLGNGDGTFQTAVTYDAGGTYIQSVTVADVNGDGKPDIVAAMDNANADALTNISVLLGNGDGTFRTSTVYASGGYEAKSVAVADVNGDGKLDLMVANSCTDLGSNGYCQSNGSVSVLLGNGDGAFQTAVTYDAGGTSTQSVTVADVNGDGKPDLLVANFLSDSVGVLLNVSTGFEIAILNPATLSFIPQERQTTSPAQRISLFNKGPLPITVTSVNLQGDFAVSVNKCQNRVQPNTHCDMYVTFTPTGTGLRAGSITFVDTASNSPQSAPLWGTGTSGTTTTLTANPAATMYRQPVSFQALVVGTGPAKPTGQVNFLSGSTTLGSMPLSSTGTASFTFAQLGAGMDQVTAQYQGDTLFGPCTSAAAVETVNKASTTSALLSSPNPSSVNQTVTFSVTVTGRYGGSPSGVMTFKQGATVLGTATLLNGAATLQTGFSRSGTLPVTAVYGGDSNFVTSNKAISQVVNKAATTTTLSSSVNPSTYKQAVMFTATVTSAPPGTITGTVSFMDGTSVLGNVALASGKASFTTPALAGGSHSIVAIYKGSSNYLSSTSAVVTQKVKAASTTAMLAATPNPSSFGQVVKLTATVKYGTLPATGSVTFKKGTTTIGTGTLSASGVATLNMTTLPVGSNSLTAVYAGNTNLLGSTSLAVNEVVNKAKTTTTIQSSLNPSPQGTAVTFTATTKPAFGGSPSGMVAFKDGATTLKTMALSGGTAKFTTSTLSTGTHHITATYSGDTNFSTSSGALTQTVN